MGNLLQPQPLPANTPTPAATDSDEVKQKFIALKMQDFAYNQNVERASWYINFEFASFLANYERSGLGTAPDPPNQYLVDTSQSPWNPQLLPIGPPVCQIPDYPKVPLAPTPGTVAIGKRDWPGALYWNTLPTDAAPGGFITPSPVRSQDGILGIWERIPMPFGPSSGWWQLLAVDPSTPVAGVKLIGQ